MSVNQKDQALALGERLHYLEQAVSALDRRFNVPAHAFIYPDGIRRLHKFAECGEPTCQAARTASDCLSVDD